MCQEQNCPQFQREPQKKAGVLGLHTPRTSLFSLSLSRENWKQEKARTTQLYVYFTPQLFPLPILPLFGQGRGTLLREVHNAKENGLAKERCEILQTKFKC